MKYVTHVFEYVDDSVDIISMSIAQPNADGVCSDTFQIGGAINSASNAICGDNNGQHSNALII